MLDPEQDTISIGNLNAAPVISSFLPTLTLNHLVLARGASGLYSRMKFDWTYLAKAFPNLKKLSVRFGYQSKPLPGPPNHEEPTILTMDSNLIDMFCFANQAFESEDRHVLGLEKVFREMAQYRRIKRSFWAFIFGSSDASQNWSNLTIETSFETMKCYTPPLLVIATTEEIENLEQLPVDMRPRWTYATFPRYIWFNLHVADEKGDLIYSRLAGVEDLFREPEDA
ncbi:hypothetical protein BDZ45DRAFT_44972 [Acephala macrosclerotiorum]|nr:hypothetical protein BDZ45DRAFT_44972 [Acephala macrosclerotiorum]